MSQPYPHHYEATLIREEGSRASLSSGAQPVLIGGPPPEFDGDPGWWSPEHLLLSAANLCLMTTYMALAKKSGLETGRYQSRVEGVLEKTREGILFTRFTIHVDIEAPKTRLEEVRKTLEAAKKYCIVTNALKLPVEMEASIVPTEKTSSEAGAA
jgi:organic hydroperoxide reductase OsmC/OhrA